MSPDVRPSTSGSSSADSSFVGSAAASAAASASTTSASNSGSETAGVSRKRKAAEAQDLGSGDEGVIDAGRKKKRKKSQKKGKKGEGEAKVGLEEEDGVAGRVRRRRRGEGEGERKPKPPPDPSTVTIDVNEMWAQMNSAPEPAVAAQSPPPAAEKNEPEVTTEKAPESSIHASTTVAAGAEAKDPMAEDTISIKRTYVFAGETITEEKVVPKSSAEASLYQSQSAPPKPTVSSNGKPLRRPLKRKSRFDPPPETGTSGSVGSSGLGKDQGRKLNTIEKSKMDWAGYVDQAGIQEELAVAEKAKDGYLGKMDFLGRVGAKRDDEILNARTKR
ncbi:hypothetical protein MMC07_004529 [Pseudocyphellaria aurata]|nr:hypothetical protein [Pseudocyphellaria aurata]